MNHFPFAITGFDLDGTLVDTAADLGEAMNHALRSIGRADVPTGQVRGLVGGGSRRMLERALALTGGVEGVDLNELHAVLLRHYEDNIAVHSRLFPGGEAMLNALEERSVALAVVTNKLEAYARKLLEELGLASRFRTIIGGDTLGQGRAKPAPDLLHEIGAQPRGRLGRGRRPRTVERGRRAAGAHLAWPHGMLNAHRRKPRHPDVAIGIAGLRQ